MSLEENVNTLSWSHESQIHNIGILCPLSNKKDEVQTLWKDSYILRDLFKEMEKNHKHKITHEWKYLFRFREELTVS
jgi:hypothetical protein